MSSKSRRRANASHRVTMTAGALLAGAAIPIAAAGTAWAADTAELAVPVAGVGNVSIEQPAAQSPAGAAPLAQPPSGTPTGPIVESAEQLETQGFSADQA